MRHAGHAAPHVGRHVDDGAAVLLHRLDVDLAHDEEATGEVVANHGLEALLRDRRHRRRELAAGIVDEAVDPPLSLDDALNRLFCRLFVADVEGKGFDVAAVVGNFRRDPVELLLAASGDDHMRAEAGEFVRHAAPDPAPAAGNDVHLAGEAAATQNAPIAHGLPPFRTLNHVDVNVNAQL